VNSTLRLSGEHEQVEGVAPPVDASDAPSPAELQLARSLVQLGLAHLQILQTTLLDAYHCAVAALDAPGARDLALQIVNGLVQVERAGETIVHQGAELVAREAGRVLELLEAAARISSYVMPEESNASQPAQPGDQLLAVAELERFQGRPIDALFLVTALRRSGAWAELSQARGADGRTAAEVLRGVEAQAAETGATVELGPKWDSEQAAEALSYGLTDWAVTDEEATRVVEMLQAASPQGRGALIKQLQRRGLLERLAENVGWYFLQQIGETLNDPEAEALLAPRYEGKGGVPSSHEFFMHQVDRNLEEQSALDTVQAGLWYLLDTGLDAFSFGGKASIDRAHEARDAGLISEDGFWAQTNKSIGRTAAVSVAAALTGGAAGSFSEGAALALGAGEGGAAVIGGAMGGAFGNVGGRFTGDTYDQLLDGKQGFDSFATYAQDFASGGLFGAALAPVGLHGAKHLPASARTMAQTYAVHHPHLIPMLEASRAAGVGAAFRVRMTVREWLDVLGKSMGGPGGMNGLGGLQPALVAAAVPDVHTLAPDVELWITARPTVDLNAPMARLGDEDEPWFEVEAIDPASGLGPDWRHTLGDGDRLVEGMHEVDPLGKEPHQQRLPNAKDIDPAVSPGNACSGFWGDEHARGNSPWYSDNEVVNRITKYKPIQFKDGYPVFDAYAEQTIYLERMTGDGADFALADRELARRYGQLKADGTPNQRWAEDYRDMTAQTWHHHQDGIRMQLVPVELHQRIPHTGGASLVRARGAVQ
jgi:A nuclease of the HNH/ENDO VII superfamily with conserved WHH